MAIIPKGKSATESTGTGSSGNRREDEPKRVNPEDLMKNSSSLPKGEKKKLDASEANDAWSFGAPPDKGRYDLKPMLAKDGLGVDEEDHYHFNLETRIVSDDKDIDNIPVFANVTTKVGRGKNISTAAALIVKMGFKIPDKEIDELTIAQILLEALKREKIVRNCLVDWKTGYKDGDNWINVASTQDNFPKDSDGNYMHKFKVKGKDVEVQARLYVAEWGDVKAENVQAKGKNESKPVIAAPTRVNGPTKGASAPAPVAAKEPEPVVEEVSGVDPDDLQFALEEN